MAFGADAGGRPLLASGTDDRTVRLWDPSIAACVSGLRRRSAAHALAFAGAMLAIGDDEGVFIIELNAHALQQSGLGTATRSVRREDSAGDLAQELGSQGAQ